MKNRLYSFYILSFGGVNEKHTCQVLPFYYCIVQNRVLETKFKAYSP